MSLSNPTGPFRYVHSAELPSLLEELRVTLVVSTYQAGKLAIFRSHDGKVSLLLRSFEHAMGLAIDAERMAIGTRHQIWFLENDQRLTHQVDPEADRDACFLPRSSHVTGDIGVHEIAWGRACDESAAETRAQETRDLWLVNTRFSCLCTLDRRHSFVPRWRPRFVSQLAGDDRCHLNGLAMRRGVPDCVTAFAMSDQPHGWRDCHPNEGCIIDVASGEMITRGLCMPHSPRWHHDALWVLDSGTGRLLWVDEQTGQVQPVATFPGYARGLACCGQYAFVGLSKIRETATFGNVPLAEDPDRLRCGVWVFDLDAGKEVGFLQFDGDVTEVFDVQLLANRTNATVIGIQKESVQRIFSIPPHVRWEEVPSCGETLAPSKRTEDLTQPGKILSIEYLGTSLPLDKTRDPADVWYVRYASGVDGGTSQAAKLFLPRGQAPKQGWPLSLWCHGLGDPATQLRRWPCARGRWRRSRGELAGNWAQHGIATLTPWLPGDGPSEPFGTYSPLSLTRNLQAIADAFAMLQRLARGEYPAQDSAQPFDVAFDFGRVVVRTDCAASPMVVAIASQLEQFGLELTIRAFVADGFQTSILQNEAFLGPRLNQLEPATAAAIRCIWMRAIWSLFRTAGFPLEQQLSGEALDLFHQPTMTSRGPQPRIVTSQLVPPAHSELAPQVVRLTAEHLGRCPTGDDIQRWLYADALYDWARTENLPAMLQHAYYRKYLADADPFYVENQASRASHNRPLLVIGQVGDEPALLPGMPSRTELFEGITLPMIAALSDHGWPVRLWKSSGSDGTSYTAGPAQRWTFAQLAELLT